MNLNDLFFINVIKSKRIDWRNIILFGWETATYQSHKITEADNERAQLPLFHDISVETYTV